MLKKYENTIKEAIKEANKMDKDYGWKIISINENKAEFTWSYLSENDEPFRLEIESDSFVSVKVPYTGTCCGVLIGKHSWNDANTMEEGIALAIKGAVLTAKKLF
jgi:hypothetical protein